MPTLLFASRSGEIHSFFIGVLDKILMLTVLFVALIKIVKFGSAYAGTVVEMKVSYVWFYNLQSELTDSL